MKQGFHDLLTEFQEIGLVDVADMGKKMESPDRTILYSSCWDDGAILNLAAEGEYPAFLNSQNKNFDSELLVALKIRKKPLNFIHSPLSYLFQKLPHALILPFQKKWDKPHLIDQIEAFIEKIASRMVQEYARIIFEELFMNALFDAPKEARKLGFKSKRSSCQLIFAFDDEKLVISCFDPHGSLDPMKMVVRMRDIYHNGTKNILNLVQRKGGAGIGCSLLYNYSSSMIIAVQRQVGTRVTCTLPLKMSQKSFQNLGKNLHIINMDTSGGQRGK